MVTCSIVIGNKFVISIVKFLVILVEAFFVENDRLIFLAAKRSCDL